MESSIGGRIRAVRKEKRNLSQEGLARQADVSLNVVSRLERDEITDPHFSTLSRIARGLGVAISELTQETEDPKAPAPTSSPADREEELRRDYWIAESLDRTVSRWVWEVEEKQDPKDSYVMANACLEFAKDILRFDLPGDTLQERVPEAEVDGRLRWVKRLFDLSQRAQKNYATSPQADSSEIEALEQKGEPVLRLVKGEAA